VLENWEDNSFNMLWILTAVYFLLYSMVIWLGFVLYAKSLLYLGKAGKIAKNLVGFFVYVLFACFLVSPLFIAFSFVESWRVEFNSNQAYMIYFLLCFLSAPIPGGFYFKRRYLNNLKALGYFAKRR
jgi:hypothetical protein